MLLKLFTAKYNNSQPSFSAGVPKNYFKDIRDIPKLTCAKCGNQMMSRPEEYKFIDKMCERKQSANHAAGISFRKKSRGNC